MKRVIVYLATLVGSVLFLVFGNRIAMQNLQLMSQHTPALRAQITQIDQVDEQEYLLGQTEQMKQVVVTFRAKILEGELSGQVVTGMQYLDPLYVMQAKQVQQGEKIIISPSRNDSYNTDYMFVERIRTDNLIWLAVLFAVLIILFGRMKGLHTLISLTFTVLAVFFVFIPAILSGHNIYFWTILVSLYIIGMTVLIIYSTGLKSLAVTVSCLAGSLVCGGLTVWMSSLLQLTGMVDEESVYLTNLGTGIDLRGIIFAGILIGALGAIMDISISMASSMQELALQMPDPTASKLLRSGLTIGRDIMGTMSNTLVLAYIGSSLSLTLLLIAYGNSWIELFNRENVIVELLQMLVGSLGILFTIPLTAGICSWLYTGPRLQYLHLQQPQKTVSLRSLLKSYRQDRVLQALTERYDSMHPAGQQTPPESPADSSAGGQPQPEDQR